ncbi:unnamed protein product, partial [Brassica oleracea]
VYDLCHDRCACLAGHKPLIKREFLFCGGMGDGTGLGNILSFSGSPSLWSVCACVSLFTFLLIHMLLAYHEHASCMHIMLLA